MKKIIKEIGPSITVLIVSLTFASIAKVLGLMPSFGMKEILFGIVFANTSMIAGQSQARHAPAVGVAVVTTSPSFRPKWYLLYGAYPFFVALCIIGFSWATR